MKERKVADHLKERLKDPHFKELYELEEQKYAIVKKIVDHRIRHGLSQGALALKVGVTQQHISKIENAEFSNVATLDKVLRAIGYAVKITVIPVSRSQDAGKLVSA